MEAETSRLSAAEIYARVELGGQQELDRPLHNLFVSAVSAGLAMGISGFGVAVLLHLLGGDGVGEAVAFLAYPLGFLIVIIGRQQLFTENTLFPVTLVLDQRRLLAATARLWGVVLAGNVLGTLLFAVLATQRRPCPRRSPRSCPRWASRWRARASSPSSGRASSAAG